jgi:hypothetical protein
VLKALLPTVPILPFPGRFVGIFLGRKFIGIAV